MFLPSPLGGGSGVFGRARNEKHSRVKKMEDNTRGVSAPEGGVQNK
jgi:hypothetical protein